MASAANDVTTVLAAAGLSLTVGTNLFRFALQPSPDVQVAVIPYGGREPEPEFGADGVRWEYPRLQIVSRAGKNGEKAAYDTAVACYLALAEIAAETVTGTFYHRMWPLNPPTSQGADANGRPMWGFNVEAERDLG